MSVETKTCESTANVLEIRLTGKLEKQDYDVFVPAMEMLIKEHGKLRLLVYLHDFSGWTTGALWEDIKFDVKHFNDIERLAIVGESKWHKAMATFCKPFTTAEVTYFDHLQLPQARQWVQAR